MKKFKVLIADDIEIIAQTNKKIAEKNESVEVIGLAYNGQQEYDMILELKPDIVITDNQMPNMNGVDVVQKIYNSNLDSVPKFILVTADYDALFLSSRKKRISRRAVQTIIKDEMIQVKEDKLKDCHVHILRHTSTTLLYNENNINIFILKEILGHKSLKATEIYTHVPDKKLKEIMENCTISSILERERSNKNGG